MEVSSQLHALAALTGNRPWYSLKRLDGCGRQGREEAVGRKILAPTSKLKMHHTNI
jgi:hypothetical protein